MCGVCVVAFLQTCIASVLLHETDSQNNDTCHGHQDDGLTVRRRCPAHEGSSASEPLRTTFRQSKTSRAQGRVALGLDGCAPVIYVLSELRSWS